MPVATSSPEHTQAAPKWEYQWPRLGAMLSWPDGQLQLIGFFLSFAQFYELEYRDQFQLVNDDLLRL